LPILAGCVADPYTGEQRVARTAIGTGAGAAGGAAVGALVARDSGRGALIGGLAGAAIGGGIGAYMDRQDAQLRRELQGTGVSVTRMPDRSIMLNMPGDITFATGSATISSDFFAVLDSVAKVLREYDRTNIRVQGHTDSTGSLALNNRLSEQRASAVATHLIAGGVAGRRITTVGFGPAHPVADNATAAGRAQNSRVEINLTGIE